MNKAELFKIIEVTLLDHGIDEMEAPEITDSLIERLDEEGYLQEEYNERYDD